MIDISDAIFALNPAIKIIRGEEAFDIDGNSIVYDMAQAQAKLTELQTAAIQAQQIAETHKQNAIAKLTALGLTEIEVKELLGIK